MEKLHPGLRINTVLRRYSFSLIISRGHNEDWLARPRLICLSATLSGRAHCSDVHLETERPVDCGLSWGLRTVRAGTGFRLLQPRSASVRGPGPVTGHWLAEAGISVIWVLRNSDTEERDIGHRHLMTNDMRLCVNSLLTLSPDLTQH